MNQKIHEKPNLPEKKKLSTEKKSEIKKKLKELFNEEVWLDATTDTLVFCVNKHLLNPYLTEILSKYKLFMQFSLFDEEN